MRFRSRHRSEGRRTFNPTAGSSSARTLPTHPCCPLPNTTPSLQSPRYALNTFGDSFSRLSLHVTDPCLDALHPDCRELLLLHLIHVLAPLLSPPSSGFTGSPPSSSSSSNPRGRLAATESLNTAAPRRLAVSPGLWPGPSLSLFAHALPLYAPRPASSSLALGVLFRVSVLLLSQEALTGALPTHLLYEPALVKFYCAAAASALTETIWMQKRTHCTGAPICKSP